MWNASLALSGIKQNLELTICVANLEGTNERGRMMCGCGVLCAAEWSVTVLQSVRMCVVGGPSSERGGAVSNERGVPCVAVVVGRCWSL